MGWLKKKPDPLEDKSKALKDQIASVESQIRELQERIQYKDSHPHIRSTARPKAPTIVKPAAPASTEPIFEPVDKLPLKTEVNTTPEHYNDLGVRKYDLPNAWARIKRLWQRPTTSNPKLVSYLAAGSIKGLRPLRYEKRVARNRFILLTFFFILILLGVLSLARRR